MQKWIADASFLPYTLISLFPIISSYAGKNFSNALEMLCSVFVHFSFFFFQQPLWEKRALHQKCLAHRAEDFVSIVSIVLLVHCPVHENLTFPYWSSSGLFQFYYIVESWQRSNNLSPAFVQPL